MKSCLSPVLGGLREDLRWWDKTGTLTGQAQHLLISFLAGHLANGLLQPALFFN